MHKSFTSLVKVYTAIDRITKKTFKHTVFYFTGLTDYNLLTLLPVLSILAGIVGYVREEKQKSAY